MAFINRKNKHVQVKIVYYGPGRGGKTTNLENIFKRFNSRIKTDLVSINTAQDRTLYFDFLPFSIGKIGDFNVLIQLYTVPGQVKYNSTRKLVLNGADGVVFVADSQVQHRKKYLRSLLNLAENLSHYSINIRDIPLVLQYNKRDLQSAGIPLLPVDILQRDLNRKLRVPFFEGSAKTGVNVIETFRKISLLTIQSVATQFKIV
jgi:signal recognition particle receptor subunit beta